MKIRFLLALCAAILTAACGSPAAPIPEATAEATIEVTAEMMSASAGWVTVTRPDPLFAGWEYQHPEGWEVVTLDNRNFFLFTSEDVGGRLFTMPLNAGEVAFQISHNSPSIADETVENHLTTLTGFMPNMTVAEPTPITINGIDAISQRGANESIQLSFIAISQPAPGNGFIDIFAYSRTDEFEANLPLFNAVIEAVRYTLPTE